MRIFSAAALAGWLFVCFVHASQYRVNEVSRFLNASEPEFVLAFCGKIILASNNSKTPGEEWRYLTVPNLARCAPIPTPSFLSKYPATQIEDACVQYMHPTGPQGPPAWVMTTTSAKKDWTTLSGWTQESHPSSSWPTSYTSPTPKPTSYGHPSYNTTTVAWSNSTTTSTATTTSNTTTITNTTASTTGISIITNSTTTTSTTTTLNTTTSTTTTSTTSTTSSAPSCDPSFVLNGVSESAFNPFNTAFSVDVPCGTLDVQNFTIYSNFQPVSGIESSPSSISIPGFSEAYVFLSVMALDLSGNFFSASYQLIFGEIIMPVLVLDATGNPAAGVKVTANATTYPYVGQIAITDDTGLMTFTNVPQTTIGLVATTADNQIAVNGLAATSISTTLNLIPFTIPGNVTSDFDNGTIGWTGGIDAPASSVARRDTTDLEVSTDGQFDEQLASKEFQLYPFTNTVYMRYKFITAEIPGGYYGSQYNDYFSVTVRDDKGNYATYTNSMNALGLGAFDANGATDWMQLQLSVSSSAQYVHFDVAVSNVVDNLYDSEVVVDHIGDLTCDSCGDCSVCAGDPMCQDQCLTPPLKSCTFYRDCAAASMQNLCPDGGYPINYGWKNCNNFQNNLGQLSAQGQTWIWNVMHCLQLALLPDLPPQDCSATCDSVSTAAFNSHPGCYVDNGFCDLAVSDYLAVMKIVGFKELFQVPLQIITTGGLCGAQWATDTAQAISDEISTLAQDAVNVVEDAIQDAADELSYNLLLNVFGF